MKTASWCVALVLVALVMTSVVAMAQEPSGSPSPGDSPGGRRQQGGKAGQGGPMRAIMQELDLTQAQRKQIQPMVRTFHEQMRSLQEDLQQRMASILTEEQRQKMQQMRAQGEGGKGKPANPRGMMRQLNLSREQRQQMKALHEEMLPRRQEVLQEFTSQVKTVLTPEQQVRFEQLMKERGPGARGGERGGGQRDGGRRGGRKNQGSGGDGEE